MDTEKLVPLAPKRPYVTPALVVHGDVQTLTHGKEGTNADQDGGGSFIPDGGGG